FRSMAWFFQKESRAEWFTSDKHQGRFPLLDLCRKTHRKYEQMNEDGVLYGDQSSVSQLRVRKRLNTEVHGYEYAQQFDGGDRRSEERRVGKEGRFRRGMDHEIKREDTGQGARV